MEPPTDPGINMDLAEDDDVVTVTGRGLDLSRGVAFVFLCCWLLGWTLLTLSPTAAGWGPRLHSDYLLLRAVGLIQVLFMLAVWAVSCWVLGWLVVTAWGEERVVIAAEEVIYLRGAFGIARTRRWPIIRVSGFRYHPFPAHVSILAQGVRPEISLQTIRGGVSLIPGVTGDEAEWLAFQLNQLLARRRPALGPQTTGPPLEPPSPDA